mmetsp:Transcript_9402/g.12796  ORF Transcript_9402/g.12796 Transcript_9402/m.12796 type:complete len:311 (-) Transcript_9402:77-1009(-)
MSGFNSALRITAKDCDAKASFSSNKLMSFMLRPAAFKAFGIASTGPIPIILGSTPTTLYDAKRAIGCSPSSFTIFSDITKQNAAPSEVCEEFPAVTEPSAANTGRKRANPSGELALGPSSVSTMLVFSCRFSFSSKKMCFTSTGTISSLNRPDLMAAMAFSCEFTAKISCSSRETPNSLATASAVKPIPQYQFGFSFPTFGFGTIRQPPIAMVDMDSTPPAKIQSAIPASIFAVAMAIVSNPEEQYRFTVMPGTFTESNPIKEIIRPTFKPCSASGVAFPTITSSIRSLSNCGTSFMMCFTTSAAKSSGR